MCKKVKDPKTSPLLALITTCLVSHSQMLSLAPFWQNYLTYSRFCTILLMQKDVKVSTNVVPYLYLKISLIYDVLLQLHQAISIIYLI